MTTEIAPIPKASSKRRCRWLSLVRQTGAEGTHSSEYGRSLDDKKLVLGRDPGPGGYTLSDSRASRRHAELVFDAGAQSYRLVDLDSRNGTYLNGHRVQAAVLQNGSVFRIGDSILVYSEATVPDGLSAPEHRPGVSLAGAIANAAADLAAPSDLPLLIAGPTGAGKEVMAKRIHASSGRPGALVPVNCATFGRDLIGSELFGHTAGAFSGAKAPRSGLFVTADGGTLFLDEIAELPIEQQPALLRALQEGVIRPVGSDREVEVNVRVVAATHQRLDALVTQGAFREDLYARLAGFVIDLPGLVLRREEILPLFRSFVGEDAPPLSSDAAEALLVHAWPQNIRELKHVAERTKLFARNLDVIEWSALPSQVRESEVSTPSGSVDRTAGGGTEDLDLPSKSELLTLLEEHGGNVAGVARARGKHRQQVYRWLKRYGIDASSFRSDTQTPSSGSEVL